MIKPYVNKIIFLDEDDLRKVKVNSISAYEQLINPGPDTQVINLSKEVDFEELVNYVNPSDISSGNIVFRHNYARDFSQVHDFSRGVIHEKYNLFLALCHALGAKKVLIKDVTSNSSVATQDRSINADFNADSISVTGSAHFSNTKKDEFIEVYKELLEIDTTAQGGEPDFEVAQEILREHNLKRDTFFTHIYDMRKVRNNKLDKYVTTLDYVREYENILNSKLIANVDLMMRFLNSTANLAAIKDYSLKEVANNKIQIEVEF